MSEIVKSVKIDDQRKKNEWWKELDGPVSVNTIFSHFRTSKSNTKQEVVCESSKSTTKTAIVDIHEAAVKAIKDSLDGKNDELKTILMNEMSKEIDIGTVSEFDKKLAMDIFDSVIGTIAESIADPDEAKRISEAFRHNPEEAKHLIQDNLGKCMEDTQKKILSSVESVIYARIADQIINNPEWLIEKGFCVDIETAHNIAAELKAGNYTSLNGLDAAFLNGVKAELNNLGLDTNAMHMENMDPAAKHIPDHMIFSGPLGVDMSHFIKPENSAANANLMGNAMMYSPQYMVPQINPVGVNVNQMMIPQQAAPVTPVQPTVPSTVPAVPMVTPAEPSTSQMVTKIVTKKQKPEQEKANIEGIPAVEPVADESKKKVAIDFVKPKDEPKQEKPVKDTHVSLRDPDNNAVAMMYPWLNAIETISNNLGQGIKFVQISKPTSQEPCGLIQAFVFVHGELCLPKSFTIDAAGVMYDRRPKFFPVVDLPVGNYLEDYPAYLLFKGGKENPFDPEPVTAMLTGGAAALPRYSAYRPEYYELNKLVDLSSMPRHQMTSVQRKNVQNRLVDGLNKKLFTAALANDRDGFSRWRFKSFDPKTGNFTLTNENCPFRLNMPSFAKKKVLIKFDIDPTTNSPRASILA